MIEATLNNATLQGLSLPPGSAPPTLYIAIRNGKLVVRGSIANALTIEGEHFGSRRKLRPENPNTQVQQEPVTRSDARLRYLRCRPGLPTQDLNLLVAEARGVNICFIEPPARHGAWYWPQFGPTAPARIQLGGVKGLPAGYLEAVFPDRDGKSHALEIFGDRGDAIRFFDAQFGSIANYQALFAGSSQHGQHGNLVD